MTTVGSISDTEGIIKAFWSLFQHDGLAAFKLPDRKPLPPALSANVLPGGQSQIFKVRRIRTINWHRVKNHEYSTPENIWDTQNWRNRNGDLDNPNVSEDNSQEDLESHIEQDNGIEDLKCPEQQNVSAPPNVPRFIRPTQQSKRKAETVLVTVNAPETMRNPGVKTKYDRLHQFITSFFM